MSLIKRKSKQTSIITIYLIIFFVLGAALAFHFKSDPTCSDEKQNQGEKGIDCGGPCAPCENLGEVEDLEIIKKEFVYDTEDKYDIVFKVKNPNQKIGAEKIDFSVKASGKNNEVLLDLTADNKFILPGEEKYIFINGIDPGSEPSGLDVQIKNVQWNKNIKLIDPKLVILNKNYQRETGGSPYFSKASGTLVNNSNSDFNIVKVKVLLRDEKGKLLAVNYQTINTLRSEEKRDFIIHFPHNFSGSVADLEVYPETNIYDKDNYLNPQHYIEYEEKEIRYE